MRYQGQLVEWNDDKGYGFIQPSIQNPSTQNPSDQNLMKHNNNQKIFLHIKAFEKRGPRPLNGCMLDYKVTLDSTGRPQASQVRYTSRRNHAQHQSMRQDSRQLGEQNTALVKRVGWRNGLIIVYLALLAALILTRQLPGWIMALPLILGMITYNYYRIDKNAAQQGNWRVQEGTLHLLALGGGWCGALLAQQQLRHKTAKASFQQVFWLSVILNWVLLAAIVATGLLKEF